MDCHRHRRNNKSRQEEQGGGTKSIWNIQLGKHRRWWCWYSLQFAELTGVWLAKLPAFNLKIYSEYGRAISCIPLADLRGYIPLDPGSATFHIYGQVIRFF